MLAAGPLLAFAGDADPRSLGDARRNPHVDRPRVAVLLDRQPLHGAVEGIVEIELNLVLEVTPLARGPARPVRPARGAPS